MKNHKINSKKFEAGSWKKEMRSVLTASRFQFPATYFLLSASIFILLTSCGNNKEEKPTTTENRNVPTVLVSNPETHEFNASLQISGTVKPNQQVKLFAMTNGYLQQVKADIGDFVKEGQTLAVLENPELYRESEKLAAETKGKKSIYDRLKSVYEKTPQLTTIAEVEKAEAEYESMKAQLNGVALQIGYLYVKAPFSGVITQRFVDKGAAIQSGLNNSNAMPLFEIQDLQPLRLVVDVPEADAVLIDKNTKAEINFPELPGGKYSANVSRIAYGLNENTKTMRIEIDLPNGDLKIRPGMYAKVEIQRSGHKDALSVPNEAIGNVKGQYFIYVVGMEDGSGKMEAKSNSKLPTSSFPLYKVKKIEVKTGIRDEKFTELLSGEIKLTDKIVVQGKEFCSDGATVQTKELTIK